MITEIRDKLILDETSGVGPGYLSFVVVNSGKCPLPFSTHLSLRIKLIKTFLFKQNYFEKDTFV